MSIPFPNGTIEGLIQQGSVGWFRDEDTQCVVVAVMGKSVILAPVSEVCLGFPADIEDFTLDLNNKTSRFHARLWLAERGHDVGNEDRADVLAWSVFSVHRGGRSLRVVGAWSGMCDVRGGARHAAAALLQMGWAITDTDGSIIFPPLPQ